MPHNFGMLRSLGVLMLQEVHGSPAEFELEMAPVRRDFVRVVLLGKGVDEGGVAIIARRSVVGGGRRVPERSARSGQSVERSGQPP